MQLERADATAARALVVDYVPRRRPRHDEPPVAFRRKISCHTSRATGITAFLENDGELEVVQRIAGHADPRTTKLYDRRQQQLSQDEIERIRI